MYVRGKEFRQPWPCLLPISPYAGVLSLSRLIRCTVAERGPALRPNLRNLVIIVVAVDFWCAGAFSSSRRKRARHVAIFRIGRRTYRKRPLTTGSEHRAEIAISSSTPRRETRWAQSGHRRWRSPGSRHTGRERHREVTQGEVRRGE